jgi:alcohol dehydrogenase (cytochrome c)
MRFGLCLLLAAGLYAHDAKGKAHAPASAKALKNPVAAADAPLGKAAFTARCAGCHSAKGKAPDLTSHHMHSLQDGEIYWVITNGIGKTMPGFQKELTEVERWRVVTYVRTLAAAH